MNFLIDLNKTAKHVQPFFYEELEEETILDVKKFSFKICEIQNMKFEFFS
jgi:hypothetical protein